MLARVFRPIAWLVAAFVCSPHAVCSAETWITIPANDLSNWSDPGDWWRAENGTVIAESKGGGSLPKVHYLVWQGTAGKDVEIVLEYRIHAKQPRDAGINFRVEKGPFEEGANLPSYQAELDTATMYGKQKFIRDGKLFGHIHDGKRSHMFKRNLVSTASPDGKITTKPLGKFFTPSTVFRKPPDWNECRIVANGPHVQLYFNGHLANEIIDHDSNGRPNGDGIALQFRPKDAYKFEVRGLKYRALDSSTPDAQSTSHSAKATVGSLAMAGKLDQATTLYEQELAALSRPMNALEGLFLATLYVANGDLEKHEALCRRMFEQFKSPKAFFDSSRPAKSYLFSSAPLKQDLLQQADAGTLAAIKTKAGARSVWVQIARGMAHYRMGRYDLTIQTLKGACRSKVPWQKITAQTFTSMALYKKGDVDLAKRVLSEAQSTFRDAPKPEEKWNDVLASEFGFEEANKLLNP